MPNPRQRVRQIKHHVNQLLTELCTIQSDKHHQYKRFDISISSQLTTLSQDENICPYLTCQQKRPILHSTTNHECRRKKSKKFIFAASACATSTPKSSPIPTKLSLKPHQTSTPRRQKRHSTALPTHHIIPLKRIMYNKDYNQNKRRHSAVPCSKRSILPRLQPIEENPQWI